ncbi:lysozyme [Terricaulis silvestris]|nr:lysozyme [Terricaulis silvestris]
MTNAISAHGLALIQAHEGFRAEPAQMPDGNWVVGYNHVRVGEPSAPLNQDEAADLLAIDVAPIEKLVNARVNQPLNQSQFDALASFAFSIGAEAFEQSQVLRRVNAGDYVAAACAMDAWRKSDVAGELEIVDALVRRRAAEKAMFLQDMPLEASPSVFMRPQLDHAASILGAPIKYAAAPAVGSIPVAQPKSDSAAVITEILKSEPATETLLLTQVVPDDVMEEEGEIVTAHAKPVARTLQEAREAARRSHAETMANEPKPGFQLFKPKNVIAANTAPAQIDRRLRKMRQRADRHWLPRIDFSGPMQNLGLIALLAFGVLLLAASGSLALNANGQMIEFAASAAVGAPGIAAVLMSVFGFRRDAQDDDAQHANA